MIDWRIAFAVVRDRLRLLGELFLRQARRRRAVEHLARRLGWSRSQAKRIARRVP